MNHWILLGLAILAGTVLPIQAGVNSTLGRHLGSAAQASFISFLGGLAVVSLYCWVSRAYLPSWDQIASAPPHLFLGGFFGSVMVITAIILAPKIGAVALVASLVTGQLLCSLLLDHYGWVGFTVHPISLPRVMGVIMLLGGLVLIQRF